MLTKPSPHHARPGGEGPRVPEAEKNPASTHCAARAALVRGPATAAPRTLKTIRHSGFPDAPEFRIVGFASSMHFRIAWGSPFPRFAVCSRGGSPRRFISGGGDYVLTACRKVLSSRCRDKPSGAPLTERAGYVNAWRSRKNRLMR